MIAFLCMLLQSFAKINHFSPLAKLIYLFKYLVLVQIIHGKKSDLLTLGHVISCPSSLLDHLLYIYEGERDNDTEKCLLTQISVGS